MLNMEFRWILKNNVWIAAPKSLISIVGQFSFKLELTHYRLYAFILGPADENA